MKITPKKEEEVSGFSILEDGEYPFTVLSSSEIASKSEKNKGKMMFAVKLNVHSHKGDYHVYDYFADWFSEWKLRHFAVTTGQITAYESGNINGDENAFAGKNGYVKIGHQEAGKYAAKNIVNDYLVKSASSPPEVPSQIDDDVPF